MDETLRRLAELLPELPDHLRRVATRILDQPEAVAVSSMRALAAAVGVTPPTMLRLARRLGYENYDAFRAVFQAAVVGGSFRQKAASLQELGERSGETGVVAMIARAANANAERSLAAHVELVQAADLLRKAPATFVISAGALHWIGCYFQYLGRAVLPRLRVTPANNNSVVESTVGIEKGDLVVVMSVSPYSAQVRKAAVVAKSCGATVIGITDSRGSPIASSCDVLLLAGTESPQFYPSMIGIVAVIEALVALVVSSGDAAVLNRIATIDRLRHEEGGYLVK
jgi:DNA-binding MurR/RpiR family transcriptional regulator